MNVANGLLLNVFVVEVVIFAAAWLIILTHGIRSAVIRAREPALAEARDALVRGLLAEEIGPEAREKVRGLRRSERVRLFRRVAPNLRGQERDVLGGLAADMGLVDYGRRLSRSRFWWRRLRGARLLTLAGGAGDRVIELADDRHPLVRSQVAEWCGANPSDRAVETLIGMLGDPDHANRFAVQDALVRIGTEAVAPLLEALKRAREEKEALTGLIVVQGIGDGRFTPAILHLADHASARVRRRAYQALGATGGQAAADRLEAGLEDADADARAAAADALGELGHWPAGPSLVTALGDPAWDVRAAAGRALVRIGPPGELLLRRTAREADDPFASDMARHAMDTAGVVTRLGGR